MKSLEIKTAQKITEASPDMPPHEAMDLALRLVAAGTVAFTSTGEVFVPPEQATKAARICPAIVDASSIVGDDADARIARAQIRALKADGPPPAPAPPSAAQRARMAQLETAARIEKRIAELPAANEHSPDWLRIHRAEERERIYREETERAGGHHAS